MLACMWDTFAVWTPPKEPPPLPDDLIYSILSYLQEGDLARSAQVCRGWNGIIKGSTLLKEKMFVRFPSPLRKFLSQQQDGIPTLTIHEKRAWEILVLPDMMTAPVMFIKEDYKRTALAIKYYVSKPGGIGGYVTIVLHETTFPRRGVWTCSDNSTPFKNLGYRVVWNPYGFNNNQISFIFYQGWEKNPMGQFEYLEKLLRGEPCPLIKWEPQDQQVPYQYLESTFKNEQGEDIPFIRLAPPDK